MEVITVKKMKKRLGKKLSQADWLLVILIFYCSASLLHFIHNAIYIDEYPNLPSWISAFGVYITWFGITSIGIIGYLFIHYGKKFIGLVACAVYGAIGLDGLGHYSLAPISAHTFTMNFTIWLEAITAMIVLIVVTGLMTDYVKHHRQR